MTTRTDHLPFGRGVTDTADSNDNFTGKQYVVEDLNWTSSAYTQAMTRRTNQLVTIRLVKNSAAIALLPKRLVRFKDGTNGTEVDGYTTTTAAEAAGVVDEWLPAAGVPVGSYFYVAVAGPSLCLTSLAGDAENVIAERGVLVALTGATSGATTSGRVVTQTLTGSSQLTDYTTIINATQNAIGRALSAKTTGQTNGDVLVDLAQRWNQHEG